MIEAKQGRNRSPVAVYPLGFSKQGRFAWMELAQGFDTDGYTWLVEIVDLDRDRKLKHLDLDAKDASLKTLCQAHGATIARVLAGFEIAADASATLALEQPDQAHDPTAVRITVGARDRQTEKTPYQIALDGKDGTKRIGVVWRVWPESGAPPVSEPKLAGILRSPFEPRVAVVLTQRTVGVEAQESTVVTVLGGRLDRGWQRDL